MKVKIRTREIDLTDAIRDYTEKKMLSLLKFYSDVTMMDVELARKTNHHRKGDVYTVKVNVSVPGKVYRVEETESVLYKAIDKAKDDIQRVLKKYKGKKEDKKRKSRKTVLKELKNKENEI